MVIRRSLDVPGFKDYVNSIRECGDHPLTGLTDKVLDSVVEVIDAVIEEKETWEDTSSKILVRLEDGQFGLFYEWSDSSGHG